MKKICAVTTIETTMEAFVIPAMRVFVEKGYEVSLICTMSDSFKEKYSGEFNLIPVNMVRGISVKEMLIKPFEFYKIFKRERFDYLQYATTNASFYAALPARLLEIKTRVYCSWGLLYVGYKGLKRTLLKWVEKYLCWSATHITVASRKNLEYAVADGLFPADKASVVGDGGTVGVDLNEFSYSKRGDYLDEVLKQYPVLKGKTVFGYVGRIERDKGVQELLAGFLSLRNPEYALLLIGPFDELRCNLDPELIQRAKACENVIFHGFSREVPKYMSAMDILVHPTYREGFSMVIQQAMAMGCAVITTDIPGPSEVIVDGESGVLVPPYSAEELASAMEDLAQNGEKRESLAQNALERVRTLFNRERMVRLTYENRIKLLTKQNV